MRGVCGVCGVCAALLRCTAILDRPALAERWEAAFEVPLPRSCQATLLRKSRSATQTLKQATSSSTVTLSPGTRLLREWQGQTHHVTVVERGFKYDGKVWRSLSGIARSITGTPWSGSVFFGLKT